LAEYACPEWTFIAERLYLSHRTVENKLYAVYEKLGVHGRAELAEALDSF
jgi:DNA-binding NarL/FixJ family response regulator